jgi:hypothetical protein
VEQEGVVSRIRGAQANVLNSLLSAQRMNRLVDYEVLAAPRETLYSLPEMLLDVRRAVWSELSSGSVRVDVYRRGLQRSYLETVDRRLNPPADTDSTAGPRGGSAAAPATANSDVRPALRGELLEIDRAAESAMRRTSDPMTRLHLRDVRFEIDRILDREREGR